MPDLTKIDDNLLVRNSSGAPIRCDNCGSLFIMDSRGNCSSCGAPVPLSFTRSAFAEIEDPESQLDTMRSLSFEISAAATTNPWLGKAWGIDVSRYQTVLNIPVGAIDFAMVKMGGSEYSDGVRLDPLFAQHIQSVYDAKAIPLSYWYVDSSFYPERQYSWGDLPKFTTEGHPILSKIIEGLRAGSHGWKYVKAIFFDVEGEGGGDNWTTHYIDDLQSRIVSLQRANYLPQFELGIYSRKMFLDTMPVLSNWIFNHPEIIIWAANYVRSFPGTLRPLADHRTLSLPTHNPMWFGDHPTKPKEFKRFWQYMGSFDGAQNATCPEILGGSGKPSALDLNVSEYTRAELHAALGIQDRLVETKPEDPPVVVPPVTSGSYVLKSDFDALVSRFDDLETKLYDHTHPGEKPVF
jgi:hypothetical protein